MREAILRGDPLSTSEISGLVSAATNPNDAIARLTRLLNGALLVAAVVLAADALRLIEQGVDHPPNAVLLIVLLVGAAISVGIVGEADARHLDAATSNELSRTTLGRIARLDEALDVGDLPGARQAIQDLHRSFPAWGLLAELDAYVTLREGDVDGPLNRVSSHLDRSDDVYVSALVGSAAALDAGKFDVALRVIDQVERKRPLTAEELRIRRAVCLLAGHLDEMVDGAAAKANDGQELALMAQQSPLGSNISGALFEGIVALEGDATGIDLRAESIRGLSAPLEALLLWNHSSEVPRCDGTPFALLLDLVASRGRAGRDPVAEALRLATTLVDGEALESIGFVLLVLGHPRPAIDVFERSIALRPKYPRVHWAHAVSCWRWGWDDKARESAGRALALDREDLVLAASAPIIGRTGSASTVDEGEFEHQSLRPTQRLQLALIGVDVKPAPSPMTSRERFAEALIDAARELHGHDRPASVA